MKTEFNPAAWVARAEALGLRVVYADLWRCRPDEDWRHAPVLRITEPDEQPAGDRDLELYRELRPDDEAWQRNKPALLEYLQETGRAEYRPRPMHVAGGAA